MPAKRTKVKPELSEFVTKKSEEQEHFDSGAQRDSREGKGRYDLIPPLPMKRVAAVYERGGLYYGDRNWEMGFSFSRCFDSALRHLYQALDGQKDEDHLGQAVFNIFAIMHYQEEIAKGLLPSELNDLPNG